MRRGDISGDSYTLKSLFEGAITYTIDYYQREYAWSDDDVRTLVEDLHREYAEYRRYQGARRSGRPQAPPYFLGPFVYYEDRNKRRFLVDGQQRFTTLHLIFIFTRRMLDGLDAAHAAGMLSHAITAYDDHGRPQYRIAISERIAALDAFCQGRPYEPPANATLSVRNLVARAHDIEELLEQQLDAEERPQFATWLMSQVVMVGIRAPSRNNAYRIFETMNDRGARLTSIDLLKSFLLSNAGGDEANLNERWRHMLGELTATRDDHDAPARFLKAALIAKYAGVGGPIEADIAEIGTALNVWVQRHRKALGLDEGQPFSRFVDELIELATRYRTFLAATRRREPHHGMEAIYFNEINGLGTQMIAILAAVQHDDPLTVAKEKASRIAGFIDRWYALRVIDDLPVQQSDLSNLMVRLLELLRTCRTADEVTAVLDREITEESPPFSAFSTFRMRENNKHQVRYLLARITAYVAEGLGKANEIERYLSSERSWQIEHIFADHPERHPEITDPLVYRALRNRLGVLVLLPRRDNNSLNDLPYAEKINTYSRHNDLAAVLNQGHLDRNPTLRDFKRANQIESLFRAFNANDKLEYIATVRQQLYLALCRRIWDPGRLRIGNPVSADAPTAPHTPETTEATQGSKSKAPSRRRLLQSHVGKLIRVGDLQPGEKIVGIHEGTEYWASIEDDGAIVLVATGVRYTRIDEAAREVRQKGGVRGVEFWHKVNPGGTRISLHELLSVVG